MIRDCYVYFSGENQFRNRTNHNRIQYFLPFSLKNIVYVCSKSPLSRDRHGRFAGVITAIIAG